MSITHHSELPFQLLQPTKCYVDTISIFVPWRTRTLPQPTIIKELAAVNNSGAVFPQKCGRWPDHWGWKLTVQAPSESALLMLDDYQRRYKGKITNLHIAIDLFADDLSACENWLQDHVVLKYRKRGPMAESKNTISWVYHVRRRPPTRNIQLYSDRPSKLNNQPCNHLEIRMWRCRTIKRLGLYQVRDVMRLDPTVLMPRLIKLWEPHEEGTPAQRLYDDLEERKQLKPVSLDTLLLPQSIMFVRPQRSETWLDEHGWEYVQYFMHQIRMKRIQLQGIQLPSRRDVTLNDTHDQLR